LVGYFAPRYRGYTEEQVHNLLTTKPEAFESALRMMHKEHYADRDYQTFRGQYIKNYGDPFAPQQMSGQPGPKQENEPNAAVNLAYEYEWGEQTESDLETGDYSTSVDRDYDPEATKQLNAYESLSVRREGRMGMSADEVALATAENPEYIKARMEGRTPYETLVGAEAGQKREFDYRVNAIAEENATINQATKYLKGQLENRYGEDFFERLNREQIMKAVPGMNIVATAEDEGLAEKIAEDPQAQELADYMELYEKNIARAKELMKADDYKLARSYAKDIEEVQQQIDESDDPVGRGSALVMRTFGKAVKSLGAGGQVLEASFFGDDEYGTSNALWEFFQESGQALQDFYPTKSRNSRPLFTQTVDYEMNGVNYQVDFKDGKPQAVRDEDGDIVRNPFTQNQMAEIAAKTPEERVNWGAGIYKSADLLADLGVQVALTKGTTGLLTKAGATQAFASKAGVTAAVAGQMAGPMLDKGKELFPDDPQSAAQYALLTSTLIGMSANMFGLESKLAGGSGGFVDDLFGNSIVNQQLRTMAGKKASPAALASATTTEFAKAGLGEAFEETVLERLIDDGVRSMMGVKHDNIDMREVGETAALSFAVGLLGQGPIAVNELQKSALEVATKEPNKYRDQLSVLLDNGAVTVPGTDPNSKDYETQKAKYLASQQQRMEEVGSAFEAMRPYTKSAPDAEVLALIDKRREAVKAAEKIEAAGLEAGLEDLKAEAAMAEKQLTEISNGKVTFRKAEDITPDAIYEPERLPEGESAEEAQVKTEEQTAVEKPVAEYPIMGIENVEDLSGMRAWLPNKGAGVIRATENGFVLEQENGTTPLQGNISAEAQGLIVFDRPVINMVADGIFNFSNNPDATYSIKESIYGDRGVEKVVVEDTKTGQETTIRDPELAQDIVAKNFENTTYNLEEVIEVIAQEPLSGLPEDQASAVEEAMSGMPDSAATALSNNQKAFVTGSEIDATGLEPEQATEAAAWMEGAAEKLKTNNSPFAQKLADQLKQLADAYKRTARPDAISTGPGTETEGDGAAPAEPRRRGVDLKPEDTIDDVLEKAREAGYDTSGIAAKVEFLQEQAEGGSQKAQAALDAQENLLREQLSGTPANQTTETDAALDQLIKEARLKGKDTSAYQSMRGQPLAEDFDIEAERAALGTAEPGSPLDPSLPDIGDSSTFTQEEIATAINDTARQVRDTKEAVAYAREQVYNQDFGSLAGKELADAIEAEQNAAEAPYLRKMMAMQARMKRLKASEAALLPSNHTTEQDYREALKKDADKDGVQIEGASMGVLLTGKNSIKFLKFLYGLAGGRMKIDTEIAVKKFWAGLRKNTVGALPRAARLLNVDRVSAINAQMERAKVLSKQLRKAAKKHKIDMRDPAVSAYINELFRDPTLNENKPRQLPTKGNPELPNEMLEGLRAMRNHIDRMSLELIDAGLTDGPLMDVITENMGVYVHRSYQIHNDPDWIEKVMRDPDIWNPGIAWWVGQLQDTRTQVQDRIDKLEELIDNNQAKMDAAVDGSEAYQKAESAKAFWEEKMVAKEEQLDILDAKIKSPAASLEAMLRGQQPVASGRGGKLGAKQMGIFEMRGGKPRRDAVKAASKKLTEAKKEMAAADKARNKALEKHGQDSEQYNTAENAFGETVAAYQQAEQELAEAHEIDIPPELRALYGEYESVLTNYMHTIYKQSALSANHQFLSDVREAGLRQGWLRTPEDPQGEFTQEIAAESSSVMSPLNGMLTSPEIAKAFEDYAKAYRLPTWFSTWMRFTGITKKWLTVYSPVGHIRNIVTGGYFHALSGDFAASPAGMGMYANGIAESVFSAVPGANYAKNSIIGGAIEKAMAKIAESENAPLAIQNMAGAFEDMRAANKQAFRVARDAKADEIDLKEYEEYVALGLTDESVDFGIVMGSIRQYREGFTSPYSTLTPGPDMERGMERRFAIDEFAQATYQASDTAHRILRFKRDLRRYANSRGIDLADLAPGQNMEFKQEVADIARRTYPTYSRMPAIVSAIGKSPVIGPFISFHYTAGEAAVNNITQGVQDIKNGDTGIGVSRMLGVSMANIAYSAALKGTGAAMVGALGYLSGPVEDEDDDDNKWTHFLPPWSKYSKVSIFPTGKGDFVYVDHGQQVPNTALFEVMESALQGNFKRAGDGISKEIIGPFIGWDVFTKTSLEALLNQKNFDSTRPIYQKEDLGYVKAYKSSKYILKRVQPGLASTAGRITTAARNYLGRPDYGEFKNYKIGTELMTAATGIRVSTGDVGLSFSINARTLKEEMNDALWTYRSKAARLIREFPELTRIQREAKLKDELEYAKELAAKSVEKMIAMYEAAKKTDLPPEELEEKLKKSGFPAETREGIKYGIVVLPRVDHKD